MNLMIFFNLNFQFFKLFIYNPIIFNLIVIMINMYVLESFQSHLHISFSNSKKLVRNIGQ